MSAPITSLTVYLPLPVHSPANPAQIPAFSGGGCAAHPQLAWDAQQIHSPAIPESVLPQTFRSPFLLPPNGEKYLIGLAAETASGAIVLGTAEYIFGRHEVIASSIEANFGPIKTFVWGGEIYLKNNSAETAVATLMKVNETSGFLYKKEKKKDPSVLTDRIGEVQKLFANSGAVFPFCTNPAAQYIPYDPENSRLDTALLQAFGALDPRHDLGNMLQDFMDVFALNEMAKILKQKSYSELDPFDRFKDFLPTGFAKLVALRDATLRDEPELEEALSGIMDYEKFISLPKEKIPSAVVQMETSFLVLESRARMAADLKPVGAYDLFALLEPANQTHIISTPPTPPDFYEEKK